MSTNPDVENVEFRPTENDSISCSKEQPPIILSPRPGKNAKESLCDPIIPSVLQQEPLLPIFGRFYSDPTIVNPPAGFEFLENTTTTYHHNYSDTHITNS